MTPNIVDRLDSMIQAMIEVVIPAIEPTEDLAKDQAALVVAHLKMIQAQVPLAGAFEQLELDTVTALGTELLNVATGESRITGACDRLASILNEGEVGRSAGTQERCLRLNAAVEDLVRSSRMDGDPAAAGQIAAKVLKFAHAASWRDRVWFNGSGFDAEQQSLPDRASIFG